jgi:hypothetical protein
VTDPVHIKRLLDLIDYVEATERDKLKSGSTIAAIAVL